MFVTQVEIAVKAGLVLLAVAVARSLLGVRPTLILRKVASLASAGLDCAKTMQVALTLGTVVFGLYVAAKLWTKQDLPGKPARNIRGEMWHVYKHIVHAMLLLSRSSSDSILVEQGNHRVSHQEVAGNQDSSHEMMTACQMYGLKTGQNGRSQKDLMIHFGRAWLALEKTVAFL